MKPQASWARSLKGVIGNFKRRFGSSERNSDLRMDPLEPRRGGPEGPCDPGERALSLREISSRPSEWFGTPHMPFGPQARRRPVLPRV
jgi:hypothetical protein